MFLERCAATCSASRENVESLVGKSEFRKHRKAL